METKRITGSFEVTLTPAGPGDAADGVTLGRMALTKRFLGELEGSSQGEMLSARTATAGSAGYVAIERVRGTLAGRAGTFVLQHMGVLNRGAQDLTITVVPDSGTGELVGLSGKMGIVIEGGKHGYVFDYSFGE